MDKPGLFNFMQPRALSKQILHLSAKGDSVQHAVVREVPMFTARYILLFLILLALPSHAGELASQDPQKVKRAEELVQALASDSYAARAQAKTQLMQLGRPAIEPLEAALVSSDPELQIRATELLIDLRGRGFLGVGLSEEEVPVTDGSGAELPPIVVASQIVNFMQYANAGVTRPFPAEVAGIQQGDKILAVNERPVHGVQDLKREVTLVGPGRVASLLIEREGKPRRVSAVLTRNPIPSGRMNVIDPAGQGEPPPPIDLEREYYSGAESSAPDAGNPVQLAMSEIEKMRKLVRESHNDPAAIAKLQERITVLQTEIKTAINSNGAPRPRWATVENLNSIEKDLQDLQTLLTQLRKP